MRTVNDAPSRGVRRTCATYGVYRTQQLAIYARAGNGGGDLLKEGGGNWEL